jgi:hypothetical protein
MVDEVDDDGSGELEYKEFVQIMTDLLTKTDTSKGQPASALPFEVTATAYRRCAIVSRGLILDVKLLRRCFSSMDPGLPVMASIPLPS